MRIVREGGWVRYEHERTGPHETLTYGETRRRDVMFRARYRPVGEAFRAEPSSLESFFTDRFCLYSCSNAGKLYRAEIHHALWPLRVAEAEVEVNTMGEQLGIDVRGLGPPRLHYVERMDVAGWWPEAE
jgi:uncharacterized protein